VKQYNIEACMRACMRACACPLLHIHILTHACLTCPFR